MRATLAIPSSNVTVRMRSSSHGCCTLLTRRLGILGTSHTWICLLGRNHPAKEKTECLDALGSVGTSALDIQPGCVLMTKDQRKMAVFVPSPCICLLKTGRNPTFVPSKQEQCHFSQATFNSFPIALTTSTSGVPMVPISQELHGNSLPRRHCTRRYRC